ncbi:MAG TPA: hypothetical protein VGN30_04850 [Steroidobacteraceae bacterium]
MQWSSRKRKRTFESGRCPVLGMKSVNLAAARDTRWIPSHGRARFYIACHDTPGADDDVVFDSDPGENDGTAADPHIASDLDRVTQFGACASYRRIARMVSGIYLYCRPDLCARADGHRHHIENHAIEIEKYTRPEPNVVSVITMKRRTYDGPFADFCKTLA